MRSGVRKSLAILFGLVMLLIIPNTGMIPAVASSGAPNGEEMTAALSSPRLVALKNAIAAGHRAALENFWQDITKQGAPLIEPLKDDAQHRLVTFLWRDQKDTRVIISNDFAKSVNEMQLTRLPATDVWYKTYRMRDDARFLYQYCVDDPNFPFVSEEETKYPTKFQPDPLNPRQYDRLKPRIFSVVELPNAPSLQITERRTEVPKGLVGQIQPDFKSTILNSERRIFIYKPPGFTADGPAYPLIVAAATYVSTIPLPVVLDNLLAKGLMPPVVVVFDLPVGTQQHDSSCDARYADFLAKELIPAVRERLHATTDPKQIIVGGASMGGLSASCAAFYHPEVFGNVLSQSGSYWWSPENDPEDQWLTRQLANGPKLPIKFYLSIGLLESEQALRGGLISMLHSNRHFRDVLQARGYPVHYREINSGHDYYNWQATLADGLIALLGKNPNQPAKP